MTEDIQQNSLYYLMGYKSKYSVLKSVCYCGVNAEGFRSIEVEPYDATGYNALNTTPSKYDRSIDKIEKTLVKFYKHLPAPQTHKERLFYISIYAEGEPFEYIFDPVTGKSY